MVEKWEKCLSPDDAVKLKSFDLCPNPICIARFSPPTVPSPRSKAGCCSYLFCHRPKGKYNIPLWMQLSLCGNKCCFSFSFLLKEQAAVRYCYCQGFLKGRCFGLGSPALTSSHDGALRGMLFWWLDGTSHTHHILFTSRTSLKLAGTCMCTRASVCVARQEGGWRLSPCCLPDLMLYAASALCSLICFNFL